MDTHKQKTYLFNSAIRTNFGDWRFEPIAPERTSEKMVRDAFVSAVGHQE